MKALFVLLLGLAVSLAYCQGVGDTVSAGPVANGPVGVRVVQELGSQIPPDASFKDAYGHTVNFGQALTTRPAILLPIFYRCQGVCEMETQELLQALPKLDMKVGRDFDVIVLSIDPVEGPSLAMDKMRSSLASSTAFKGTDAGWHFLTGSLDQIRKVTDAVGFFYTFDPKIDLVNHPSGVMFLTPQARVSSYILNAAFGKEQLERNLRLAAKNTIGEKTADSFLGCVHTDPITGKRSLNILHFLSLFALVFVCGVVALVGYLAKTTRKLGLPPSTEG